MLTLVKTEKRENGWTRYFFKDDKGYEFFVQKPNKERIREKVKNLNHPVGRAYQQKGLIWEAEMREVIDSSPQQVAEYWYDNFYQGSEDFEQLNSFEIERLRERIAQLEKDKEKNQEVIDALWAAINLLMKEKDQKTSGSSQKQNFTQHQLIIAKR